MQKTSTVTQRARQALKAWKQDLRQDPFSANSDFQHSLRFYFAGDWQDKFAQCRAFAKEVSERIEGLCAENDDRLNLPRLDSYDEIGESQERILHHPNYQAVGELIYASGLLAKTAAPGGLLEALCLFYLSCHAGEAGHNCPIACSAGLIRILRRLPDVAENKQLLQKLTTPSFKDNYTAAQFLTEVQGGSDVGKNECSALLDAQDQWRISGEKWFCSNAGAELILMTARPEPAQPGTRGLGLYLVPRNLASGERNTYHLGRIKEKLGTRTLVTAEIEFNNALAYQLGAPGQGFKMMMEEVLHLSRLFNSFCVCGMGRRAYQQAAAYAHNREAFGQPLIQYPLVQETLAQIRSENNALLCAAMDSAHQQDLWDKREDNQGEGNSQQGLLLRLLANLGKCLSANWSVEHIHHSIDILAGNGTIESFSSLPRLFRDSIVCENWEGTHNTLRMQTLRDIQHYQVDRLFVTYIDQKITSLTAESALLEPLHQTRKRLDRQLAKLAQSDARLQSLMIKEIVDSMAILHCGTCLLAEAIHQQKLGETPEKLLLYRYFSLLRLTPEQPSYDTDYLDLIASIING